MNTLNFNQHPNQAADQAAQILKNGGLIVYPTDTIYGLGADATNQAAVDRLLEFKGKREHKAISIAVRDQKMAEQYTILNPTAQNLYQTFLPGPLTVVSQLQIEHNLSEGVFSRENTIGIRIIPHSFLKKLFQYIDFPITATSANISGASNPHSLKQFKSNTPEKKQALVDLFIDAGTLPRRQPSTVIDTTKEDSKIIRQGPINLTDKMYSITYQTNSENETKHLAKDFLKQMFRMSDFGFRDCATIVALQGPLGAGKTVFTKGLAKALGIDDPIRSPTYTFIKEYKLKPQTSNLTTLYHLDAWRLASPEEFEDLDLANLLQPGNLIVLEWPQRLTPILNQLERKAHLVLIDIKPTGETTRTITISHPKKETGT